MSITSNIKLAIPKIESTREFMKFVEECSQTANKFFTRTLMSILINMKFDGSHIMHEYVIEMTNIATRLNLLE